MSDKSQSGTSLRVRLPNLSTTLAIVCIVAICWYCVRGLILQQAAAHHSLRVRAQQAQIHSALLNYAAAHKTLPPLSTKTELPGEGLSWRVLILPYLGEKELFKQFDLSKSWDAPENLSLLNKMPDVYSVKKEQQHSGMTAHWAVQVDGNWNGGEVIIANSTLSDLALVTESPDRTEWTRPVDFVVAPKSEAMVREVLMKGGFRRPPIAIARNGTRIDLPIGTLWNSLVNLP